MVISSVKCAKCNNIITFNKNQILNEDYDICHECYDFNKNILIDIDFFKDINFLEKAYLLGLFYLNINKNNIVSIYNFKIRNDLYLYKLIKKIGYNINNDFNSKECMFSFKFSLNPSIINDINNHYENNFLNFSDNNLKMAFIRGYREGSVKSLDKINDAILYYNDLDKIKKITDFINIPFINNEKSKYILYEDGCNSIDFLGKIYNDSYNLRINYYNNKNYNIYCKVLKTDNDAIIPFKTRESDVGYDLTIIKEVKKYNSKTTLYDTGIKIELSKDYYAEIVPRSSLSKSGYILSNSIGIIDNSYRGNLFIALTKICDDMPNITLPNRCCQLIIKKQLHIDLYEVDEEKNLYNTTRNEGGFGSTG